jgi:hypothetical protein
LFILAFKLNHESQITWSVSFHYIFNQNLRLILTEIQFSSINFVNFNLLSLTYFTKPVDTFQKHFATQFWTFHLIHSLIVEVSHLMKFQRLLTSFSFLQVSIKIIAKFFSIPRFDYCIIHYFLLKLFLDFVGLHWVFELNQLSFDFMIITKFHFILITSNKHCFFLDHS